MRVPKIEERKLYKTSLPEESCALHSPGASPLLNDYRSTCGM